MNLPRNLSMLEIKLSVAFATCEPTYYPNMATVFQLMLILPVSSCSCAESFSSLSRLKTWNRITTKEDRLNGLALSFINSDRHDDPIDIL